VSLLSYATKTNRKKLTGAYSDKSPLRTIIPVTEEKEIAMFSTEGRALVFNSAQLAPKTTRDSQGVAVMTLKTKYKLRGAMWLEETAIKNISRYRVRSLPAAGALLKPEDSGEEQMSIF